jgi:hypothetical protein
MRILSSLAIIVVIVMTITSCGKLRNDKKADPNAKQHNEDISNTKSESDNVNTDVMQMLREVRGFGKNADISAVSICGATIDSSQQFAQTPTLIVTFDGTTVCNNPRRIRSGQLKIELIEGNKWTDKNAKVRITHINYKVQLPDLNNHFLVFNGVKMLTNVDGIDWLQIFFNNKTAKFRERTYNMQVTFENGHTSQWNHARLSEWGIRNFNEIFVTVNGDTTIAGKTIDSWGDTRFDSQFITEMIEPWKSSTACGWWKPTQGIYRSETQNFDIKATLGTDNSGNRVNTGCPHGFKLEWQLKNSSASGDIVLRYL